MVKHDSALIDAYADRRYDQARGVMIVAALIGAAFGCILGVALSNRTGSSPGLSVRSEHRAASVAFWLGLTAPLHRIGHPTSRTATSRNARFVSALSTQIDQRKADQAYKRFNSLQSPQGSHVMIAGKGEILVHSSNNYLGRSQSIVQEGDFVVSDALNHASIIDSIRLAKAITKCTTGVYKHSDMDDLVVQLKANKGARRRVIWTGGVFSMEGSIAKLPEFLQIARDHDAIVVIDDSHATGVLGKTGGSAAEHFGVLGRWT